MKHSPSIDPAEVAHYHALAETWWQVDGPFWPLHVLNRVRVEYLREKLGHAEANAEQPFGGLKVLDVGCGGGLLAEAMAHLGAEVTGVDVVARNIEIAQIHAQKSELQIDYRLTSVEQLAQEQPQSFDVLLNMEVVEHVADLASFMTACCELVRPGGQQVVATINRNPWAWFAAVFMAERVLRVLPVGTHQWAKLRRPAEIRNHLSQNGFETKDQAGVRVNPFTRRMAIARSLAINYMLIAKKAQ